MTSQPPITLASVKERCPRLFQQYDLLAKREQKSRDEFGGNTLVMLIGNDLDQTTGLLTTIASVDFNEPIKGNGPMKTESNANKFANFFIRMLYACDDVNRNIDEHRRDLLETYDVDIDEDVLEARVDSDLYNLIGMEKLEPRNVAYDVMNSALEDILDMPSEKDRFEHLLGLFIAAGGHGMKALLGQGHQQRIPVLLKKITAAWLKVSFRVNVPKEMRAFVNNSIVRFILVAKKANEEYDMVLRKAFGLSPSSSTEAPKKKPKTKKQKKDPNAPKRPGGTFVLYASTVREQVRREYPDYTMTEVQKVIAARYKTITEEEKAVLKEQVEKKNELYKIEKAAYDYEQFLPAHLV
ncbi:hypothetical protein ACHAWF_015006 [Thalassiosira exigua]